jgi:hypothetical protein
LFERCISLPLSINDGKNSAQAKVLMSIWLAITSRQRRHALVAAHASRERCLPEPIAHQQMNTIRADVQLSLAPGFGLIGQLRQSFGRQVGATHRKS